MTEANQTDPNVQALVAPKHRVAGLTLRPFTAQSLAIAEMVDNKLVTAPETLDNSGMFYEVLSFLYMQAEDMDEVLENFADAKAWKRAVVTWSNKVKISDLQRAAEEITAIIDEAVSPMVEETEKNNGDNLVKKNSTNPVG